MSDTTRTSPDHIGKVRPVPIVSEEGFRRRWQLALRLLFEIYKANAGYLPHDAEFFVARYVNRAPGTIRSRFTRELSRIHHTSVRYRIDHAVEAVILLCQDPVDAFDALVEGGCEVLPFPVFLQATMLLNGPEAEDIVLASANRRGRAWQSRELELSAWFRDWAERLPSGDGTEADATRDVLGRELEMALERGWHETKSPGRLAPGFDDLVREIVSAISAQQTRARASEERHFSPVFVPLADGRVVLVEADLPHSDQRSTKLN